jgi:hypothetical protein
VPARAGSANLGGRLVADLCQLGSYLAVPMGRARLGWMAWRRHATGAHNRQRVRGWHDNAGRPVGLVIKEVLVTVPVLPGCLQIPCGLRSTSPKMRRSWWATTPMSLRCASGCISGRMFTSGEQHQCSPGPEDIRCAGRPVPATMCMLVVGLRWQQRATQAAVELVTWGHRLKSNS